VSTIPVSIYWVPVLPIYFRGAYACVTEVPPPLISMLPSPINDWPLIVFSF
jgi:hypothetical protein